jgi:peptidoglycan hydrolase-like amidase
MEMFLTSGDGGAGLNGFELAALTGAFNASMTQEVVRIISGLNAEIQSFENDKAAAESLKNGLQSDQDKLAAIKATLAEKKNQTQSDLNNVASQEQATRNKLADLSQQISDLNAKQQAILNEKNGNENGSVGDYEQPGTSLPSAPFSPAFAAMSYGAYTHYNGMSQYGAKGRADAGQSYKSILKFYYGTSTTTKSGLDKSSISVQGYGSMSYQYYLYGIAEMPSTWPIEALKAQAVAARTFAYKSGKPICTTESCQVFSKSKADGVKNGQYPNWKKAVDNTKDQILSGSVSAQYSSTTGGYINNIGWDVKSKWPNDAYEKLAGSPWFYRGWYTTEDGSSNCGRKYPWMSSKEMADILNSWVVWDNGTNSDAAHISPVTTSCWGGDPYSMDEMASKADKYGDKYSSVSSIDVTIGNNGQTTKVTLKTNQGTVSIDGDTFKTVFNLRAPGYVSIKSRLYDFETN